MAITFSHQPWGSSSRRRFSYSPAEAELQQFTTFAISSSRFILHYLDEAHKYTEQESTSEIHHGFHLIWFYFHFRDEFILNFNIHKLFYFA
jgi:hypothetical protein